MKTVIIIVYDKTFVDTGTYSVPAGAARARARGIAYTPRRSPVRGAMADGPGRAPAGLTTPLLSTVTTDQSHSQYGRGIFAPSLAPQATVGQQLELGTSEVYAPNRTGDLGRPPAVASSDSSINVLNGSVEAQPAPKTCYRVVHPATVRAGPSVDSAIVGEARVGDIVAELEVSLDATTGAVRVHTAIGWLAVRAADGTLLLQALAPQDDDSFATGRHSPLCAYTVVHRATIRDGATIDSAYVGEAQVGDTLHAIGFVVVAEVTRILTPFGWLTIRTKDGTLLLQPTDELEERSHSSSPDSNSTGWSSNASPSSGSTTSDDSDDPEGGRATDELECTDSSTTASGSSSWTSTSSSLPPPLPVPCTVVVRTMNGREVTVATQNTTTVEELKLLIHEKLGIPVQEQRLLLNHRELEAGELSLAEAGVTDHMDCPLHVVLRLPPTVEELEQMNRERLQRIRRRQVAYEAEKLRRRAEARRLRSQPSRSGSGSASAVPHDHTLCRASNVMLFIATVAPALFILVLARADL